VKGQPAAIANGVGVGGQAEATGIEERCLAPFLLQVDLFFIFFCKSTERFFFEPNQDLNTCL
jgi:hypothetical protein